MRPGVVEWLLVLAACGDPHRLTDAGRGADAERPDASYMRPDAAPIQRIINVAFSSMQPLVLAYRDTGPWQLIDASDGTGNAAITVTGPYEVLFACGDATGHATQIERSLPQDGDTLSIACFLPSGGGGGLPPAHITGKMDQPATVVSASTQSSEIAPWTFDVEAGSAGIADLFAFDATRMAARRVILPTLSVGIDPIDLSVEGVPYTPAALALANALPDETISNTTTYGWQRIVFTGSGTAAILVPPGLVTSGDDLTIALAASTATTSRTATFAPGPDIGPTIMLLPRLADFVFTQNGATWTTPLAGPLDYRASAPGATLALHATRNSRGTTPGLALDLDTVPGYNLSWFPHTARSLEISYVDFQQVVYVTRVSDASAPLP